MNKITYSLNYRKPKEEYTPDEELLICVRYYHKVNNSTPKIIKKSTGVKCKLKDWDTNWHKKDCRSPIMKSDKDFKSKNSLIEQAAKNFEQYLKDLQSSPKLKFSPKINIQ